MATVMILGLAVSSISFFVVFLVKICGETSRMNICKVLRVDTEPSPMMTVAYDQPELGSQRVISAEKNLIEMPKRVA